MSGGMKPNRKYQHMYAIIRYETDADMNAPIDLRITVKAVRARRPPLPGARWPSRRSARRTALVQGNAREGNSCACSGNRIWRTTGYRCGTGRFPQ